MRPIRLFTSFLLLLPCLLRAQPADDHMQVRKMTLQAETLFEKGNQDSAYAVITQAISLAKRNGNKAEIGWAMVSASDMLIQQRKLNTAEIFTEQCSRYAMQAGDSMLAAVAMLQTGQISMYNDDPDKAILAFDKCIKVGLGRKPSIYLATAYNDLGFAWGMKGELVRKSQFMHKALEVYQLLKDDAGIAQALNNLSSVYYEIGNKEKAIEYAKQSLEYREKTGDIERIALTCCNLCQYYLGINIDEAEKYRALCEKYAKQTGTEPRLIHSYITSGLVANALKKNKEAFDYELKVIGLLEKSGSNPRTLARRYIAAAFYTEQLKYDTAITNEYFTKSLMMSGKNGDKINLRDAYLYISDFNYRQKNYIGAYTHYKKYILYRDSLQNAEKEEQIAELESQYEANQKDNEIARLNNERKIRLLEIEKQKAIIAGNTATALQKQNEIDLLSKTRELQEAQLKQQAEELEKQQLLATTNAQQLQLTEKENLLNAKQLRNQKNVRNLLLASIVLFTLLGFTWFNRYQLKRKLEQQKSILAMRNTISRDLHDDIGASLSNINILNELARRSIGQPDKSREYLTKASEDIQRIR
ncbi:MAG: tetratricopeptide repeat protein [Bacteroidetes bacterium]|nr:tetratricopeptide repeat protein [Bacteroidota bacterium]